MTFWSALILGLVASPHCAGMCGGLQMAFQSGTQTSATIRFVNQQRLHLLILNLGRICTYVIAGVLFAWLGLAFVSSLNIPQISNSLRVFAALVIVLIGLQLLLRSQRPFHFLEGLGAAIWKPISRLIRHDGSLYRHSFVSGLAWGFLPCGLVYGVVLTAVFAEGFWDSGLIMLGFGVGTLPAMLLTGSAYQWFRTWSRSTSVKTTGGMFFVVGGLLMLSAPYWVSKEFLEDYPELLNMVFCVT
ncbi:sulfite exporter TauE/SafE family protein [bacterium]|nr:sulfite exporter TauE/SafE family protein [bacterium]